MEQFMNRSKEVKIYGHSNLFYWWPVWLLGFVLAFLSWKDGSRSVIVPQDFSTIHKDANGAVVVVTPRGTAPVEGRLERVSRSKNLGILYVLTLLIVVTITNVPLRGWASAVAVCVILLVYVVFAWQDWWGKVGEWFLLLSIHMNVGFYMFFSLTLLIIWLLVFLVFDRFSYWRVGPGEITHEFAFGKQVSYTTEGMAFEKVRNDPFRHWIIGLGSGDLVIHPAQKGGAQADDLAIHNVLFVGAKKRRINELIAKHESAA